VEPLRKLIALTPRLRVVTLHGTAAVKGWKLLLRKHHRLIEQRGIVWLETYHTSRQALQTPDPVERERYPAARLHCRAASGADAAAPTGSRAPADPGARSCKSQAEGRGPADPQRAGIERPNERIRRRGDEQTSVEH
jgi:hypothetical protein